MVIFSHNWFRTAFGVSSQSLARFYDHWLVIQESWVSGPTAKIRLKSVEIGAKPQTIKISLFSTWLLKRKLLWIKFILFFFRYIEPSDAFENYVEVCNIPAGIEKDALKSQIFKEGVFPIPLPKFVYGNNKVLLICHSKEGMHQFVCTYSGYSDWSKDIKWLDFIKTYIGNFQKIPCYKQPRAGLVIWCVAFSSGPLTRLYKWLP